MTDNTQVRKEQVAELYSQAATRYGRIGPDVFTPFGRWLVTSTNISSDERVLDVATDRSNQIVCILGEKHSQW